MNGIFTNSFIENGVNISILAMLCSKIKKGRRKQLTKRKKKKKILVFFNGTCTQVCFFILSTKHKEKMWAI